MSKILKRPMFRIGGSANEEGIISMAQPRKNYEDGSDYKRRIEELRPIFQAAAGQGRSREDRLSDLLISGGLNLMSAKPSGNIFSTAAGAFKEPTSQYLKGSETEDAFQRQINLAAATQGITSVDAEKLARLKLKAENEEAIIKLKGDELKAAGFNPGLARVISSYEKNIKQPVFPIPVNDPADKARGYSAAELSHLKSGNFFVNGKGNLFKRMDNKVVEWDPNTNTAVEPKVIPKKEGFFEKLLTPPQENKPNPYITSKQRFYEEYYRNNPGKRPQQDMG
jgi:hypothetical protein